MNNVKTTLLLLLTIPILCSASEDIDVAMYDEAYTNEIEVAVDIDVAMYDEAYEGLPGNEPDNLIDDINQLPATAAGQVLSENEDCNG